MGSLDPESGQPLSIGRGFRPSDSSADDTFVHHWGDDASYRRDIINIYQYGSFDKQGTIEFDPLRIYRPPKTCNHNGNYFGTTPVSTFSFKTLLTTSTTASLASSVALSAAPMVPQNRAPAPPNGFVNSSSKGCAALPRPDSSDPARRAPPGPYQRARGTISYT